MDYRIEREGYKFTITKTNPEGLNISAILYEEGFCDINTNSILNESNSEVIEIDLKSLGKKGENKLYRLEINTNGNTNDVYIPYYPSLLKSVLDSVEDVLCGCDCDDCSECTSKDKILDALFKIILFYSLSGIYKNEKLQKILNCIGCDIDENILCLLTKEKIYGESLPKQFYKKIISVYYVVLYNSGLFSNKSGGAESFPEFINYDKTVKCIKKIGIDFRCIENTLQSRPSGDYYMPK